MPRLANPATREFILRSLPDHGSDIASIATKTLGVSRTTVNNYLKKLESEGLVEGEGNTKARTYKLKTLDKEVWGVSIKENTEEDVIWREYMLPKFKNIPQNILDILQYGFDEMMNNVIDHSGSDHCVFGYQRNYAMIKIFISDRGIGIFEKIRHDCNLLDRRQALLELSKGKLTTDQSKHTGEGIFFTSRMFDKFSILSSDLYYSRKKQDDWDWLIESEARAEEEVGTFVAMEIATNAQQTVKEVFDKYVDDDNRFARTHVPLVLAKYEGEKLVSRSQARRLLSRVDRFSEVMLDFKSVPDIGQPFADEIFRVFKREHPDVHILWIHTTPEVEKMIQHAIANASEG